MTDAMVIPPKVLSSQRVYDGFLKIRRDELEWPNGHRMPYEVMEMRNVVIVLPILDDKRVVMLKQYPKLAKTSSSSSCPIQRSCAASRREPTRRSQSTSPSSTTNTFSAGPAQANIPQHAALAAKINIKLLLLSDY